MLPLLLAMDSDTLINCGKASPRLLRLVCDREVWTWMLKGIDEFTNEKLEELLAVFGSRRSTEMMSEVVKEVASRHAIPDGALATWDEMVIKVAIQDGWETTPGVFLVMADHLKELTRLAKTVSATFAILEVDHGGIVHNCIDIYKLVLAHVEQQGEGLECLNIHEMSHITFLHLCPSHRFKQGDTRI